jgi:hypothetical protein
VRWPEFKSAARGQLIGAILLVSAVIAVAIAILAKALEQ